MLAARPGVSLADERLLSRGSSVADNPASVFSTPSKGCGPRREDTTMRNLARIGSLILAGTLNGALMAHAVPSAFGGDDAAFKRNEDAPDVVTTVDDE
jgi:hypothetical protein